MAKDRGHAGLRKRTDKHGSPRGGRQSSSSSGASMCPTTFRSSPFVSVAIALLGVQLVIFNIGVIMLDEHSTGEVVYQSASIPSKESFMAQKQQRREQEQQLDKTPDGTFHGYPIYFRKDPRNIETIVHCVGENYQKGSSWQKKSCEFREYFCFDTAAKKYVVFDQPDNEKLYKHTEAQTMLDISQSFLKISHSTTNSVSLGGINLKWNEEISRLEWFPEIRTMNVDQSLSYYELPSSVVMIPFHSMNGGNPGHLVWDDFLPMFTLLSMFQLKVKSNELLLIRQVLQGEKGKDKNESRGLWASCDWTDEKRSLCKKMYKKFLPLMLGKKPVHSEIATSDEFDFQPSSDADKKSTTLVCAKQGVAGIGALTDHGTSKLHGWDAGDYQLTQNHGRGGLLYEFRNFMLRNMGIPVELNHKPPFRIVFSEKSSSVGTRSLDFTKQKEFLKKTFHPSYVSVESYVFSEMSLAEQLEISSQASIFITSCGGGAVTSMFMPRGSSVLMYYLEEGGVINNKLTGKPARLDWDLFNNMSHLKVHWLPSGTMHTDADTKALVFLIQHELESLLREKSYEHFFN